MRGWRAAPQKETWGFGLVANWIRINSMPWQPKGPTMSWGTSNTASPAGWVRSGSHSTLHWWGPTSSTMGSFGHLSLSRTRDYYSASRGERPKWWKASKARLPRSSWGRLVCSAWRREGWGVPSSQTTVSSLRGSRGGAADLLSLVTSNRTPGNRLWSCVREVQSGR